MSQFAQRLGMMKGKIMAKTSRNLPVVQETSKETPESEKILEPTNQAVTETHVEASDESLPFDPDLEKSNLPISLNNTRDEEQSSDETAKARFDYWCAETRAGRLTAMDAVRLIEDPSSHLTNELWQRVKQETGYDPKANEPPGAKESQEDQILKLIHETYHPVYKSIEDIKTLAGETVSNLIETQKQIDGSITSRLTLLAADAGFLWTMPGSDGETRILGVSSLMWRNLRDLLYSKGIVSKDENSGFYVASNILEACCKRACLVLQGIRTGAVFGYIEKSKVKGTRFSDSMVFERLENLDGAEDDYHRCVCVPFNKILPFEYVTRTVTKDDVPLTGPNANKLVSVIEDQIIFDYNKPSEASGLRYVTNDVANALYGVYFMDHTPVYDVKGERNPRDAGVPCALTGKLIGSESDTERKEREGREKLAAERVKRAKAGQPQEGQQQQSGSTTGTTQQQSNATDNKPQQQRGAQTPSTPEAPFRIDPRVHALDFFIGWSDLVTDTSVHIDDKVLAEEGLVLSDGWNTRYVAKKRFERAAPPQELQDAFIALRDLADALVEKVEVEGGKPKYYLVNNSLKPEQPGYRMREIFYGSIAEEMTSRQVK